MTYIVIWLICGFICSVLAGSKGRSAGGFFLMGVLLGPLGVVLAAVIPKNEGQIEKEWLESGHMKKCPMCAELVKAEARICKHCQADLTVRRKEETAPPAKVTDYFINPKNTEQVFALCSCGKRFKYETQKAGSNMACPGCLQVVALP